jgi:hypothetical protein
MVMGAAVACGSITISLVGLVLVLHVRVRNRDHR